MQGRLRRRVVDQLLAYENRSRRLGPETEAICRQLLGRVDRCITEARNRSTGPEGRAAALEAALDELASDPNVHQLMLDISGEPEQSLNFHQHVVNTGDEAVVMVAGGNLTQRGSVSAGMPRAPTMTPAFESRALDPPFPLPRAGSKAWTGNTDYKRLSFRLAAARGRDFRRRVLPFLRVIWPRAFDGFGADATEERHLVTPGDGESRLVVLCLGFGSEELGGPEVKLARSSIQRFRDRDLVTHSYLVVHNRDGRSREFRDAIQAGLDDLVRCGRARHAELWDRQKLLREAFHAMLRRILGTVRRVPAPFGVPRESPSSVLGGVPLQTSTVVVDQYQLRSVTAPRTCFADPVRAILDRGDSNLSVLVGEFGSGKTTTVARVLAEKSFRAFYVPGARISDKVTGTKVFPKVFLELCLHPGELFADLPIEDQPVLESLSRPVVEYVFKDPLQPAALILDGIDESAFLTRRGGFQHLFNLLHEIRIPVILTLRKELWERGQGDFAAVFGQVDPESERRHRRLQLVELLPWTAGEILALVRRCRERVTDRAERSRLDALAMLVETGRFRDLYGDLPERPLFLRLILESVLARGLPAHRMSRAVLVRDWVEHKILRDLHEPIRSGGAGRLPIQEGVESGETTLEIAWEAMVLAAGAMVREYEGELELTADCELDRIFAASPRLETLREPLGLYLNSLLLPSPRPRGTPPRVRFAHRTFQEFFLAWHGLERPGAHAGMRLPEAVMEWSEDIEREGLLRRGAPAGPDPVPSPSRAETGRPRSLAPPDLEIRVTVETAAGGVQYLNYLLRFATGKAGFHDKRYRSRALGRRPEEYHGLLFDKLEKLHGGTASGAGTILRDEVVDELILQGTMLYRDLFPKELRAAWRAFRNDVRTILLISDEPWIPWEIVCADDGEGVSGFLCGAFQLTRWLARAPFPEDAIQVERLACFEAGSADAGKPLPYACDELRFLRDLARRHPGVDDRSLPDATSRAVKTRLREDGLDLLHFVGHGRFDPDNPDESGFHLVDEKTLRSIDLLATIRGRIRERRPLVFLNACQLGRQGLSLTGLGGWATRWLEDCECGAFIAPLWTVDDRLAHLFAMSFYRSLEEGCTFGEAAAAARDQVRDADPRSPTWLAFAVYAHPNARLRLGSSEAGEP